MSISRRLSHPSIPDITLPGGGLVYVFIRWLQENLGLTPVIAMGYLLLLAWAVLATVAIMPQASREGSPIEKSPWMTWHTSEHV